MATYQKISIEDFKKKGARRITPHTKPDLPEEITGSGAFWKNPGKSPKDHDIPPSYHVFHNNEDTPIEFLNNEWCYIQWDDDKFLEYWVFPSQTIEQGKHNLGWIGNIIETQTPTSLIQFRERAESGSTRSKQHEESREEEPEGEDPMDKNPEQTERLAQTFMENPVFQDIAEAIDEPQDRAHYLPTTLPTVLPSMRPVGLNPPPLKVRSAQEPTIGATTNTTKLITNAIKLDGNLKGKVPDSFDGDRTKTTKFINAFSLFQMNNEDNSHMKNPYKRCTYFLGLFNGNKVDDWVEEQTNILREKTTRRSDPVAKSDESLWTDLIDSFANAFAHTGKVEEA
jgi:hypothetical protein